MSDANVSFFHSSLKKKTQGKLTWREDTGKNFFLFLYHKLEHVFLI